VLQNLEHAGAYVNAEKLGISNSCG